jgi:uncharacterized protein YkwD
MRQLIAFLGLGFFVAACFTITSCKEPEEDTPDNTPPLEGIFSHQDSVVFNEINEYRIGQNLSVLKASKTIWVVANIQSLGMAKGEKPLSHDGFDIRAEQVRKIMGSTGEGQVGENLASISPNILNSLVDYWAQSPEHRKNIAGDYTYCAVSIVPDNSGHNYYITALFYK